MIRPIASTLQYDFAILRQQNNNKYNICSILHHTNEKPAQKAFRLGYAGANHLLKLGGIG